MSEVKGENITKLDNVPRDQLEPSQAHGRMRIFMDEYECAALAAASTIEVARIPKGARIMPGSRIVADALGSGVTIAAGDGTTADKYLAAAAMNTANLHTELNKIDALGEKLEDEETIYLTTGGAAATGTIKTFILYVLD